MNALLFEKLYFVNLLAHQMQYSKRSKEFSLELLIPLNFDSFAIQLNFIAREIAFKLCIIVMILFIKLLCMFDILSTDSH